MASEQVKAMQPVHAGAANLRSLGVLRASAATASVSLTAVPPNYHSANARQRWLGMSDKTLYTKKQSQPVDDTQALQLSGNVHEIQEQSLNIACRKLNDAAQEAQKAVILVHAVENGLRKSHLVWKAACKNDAMQLLNSCTSTTASAQASGSHSEDVPMGADASIVKNTMAIDADAYKFLQEAYASMKSAYECEQLKRLKAEQLAEMQNQEIEMLMQQLEQANARTNDAPGRGRSRSRSNRRLVAKEMLGRSQEMMAEATALLD